MPYKKLSGFSDEINQSVDVQFSVLKKLGISYFEPRGIDGKNISELSDSETASLKEKMERYGIRASSVGSPIGKVNLKEPFEPHFELFKRVAETANKLDCGFIRIFSFYHDGGGNWTEQEREEVLSRLGRMIEYSRGQGITLLHENEKGIYGDIACRCDDLMKELGCEAFRAVFDPANFVQCGQDTMEAYELLKDHIAYMHIKDACAKDGRVVPSGAGDGRVEEVLRRLFEKGFDGFLSIEPHLGSFDGLAALETDDKMLKLPEGGEGTFTLAYMALNRILEKI